jgi:Protein of unknown function (DUF3431)
MPTPNSSYLGAKRRASLPIVVLANAVCVLFPLTLIIFTGVGAGVTDSRGDILLGEAWLHYDQEPLRNNITDSINPNGKQSRACCLPGEQNVKRALNCTPLSVDNKVEGDEADSYTLVVVHCRANITWLNEVPVAWRVVLYEKCEHDTEKYVNTTLRHNFFHHRPANEGSEECNGYLDYMHDYYDDLTSVTVFMHDDGLWPYSKWKGEDAHTPFETFEPIVTLTKQFVTKDHPFLHFGVTEIEEEWGTDPSHGPAMRVLWPYFAKPMPGTNPPSSSLDAPPTELTFKPSAHFAVRREQIQMRPKSTYFALLQQLRFANTVTDEKSHNLEARDYCCAMERMWHIFFGEPAILPKRAMALELLKNTSEHRQLVSYNPRKASPKRKGGRQKTRANNGRRRGHS